MNRVINGSVNGVMPFWHQTILNQCCLIVNWTLRDKLKCNLRQNMKRVLQENAFEKLRWWPLCSGRKGLESRLNFPQIKVWIFNLSTLNVRGPSYLGLTRSISWLLMPWLLTSPGHQQPWYWLCRRGRFLSYLGKNFNYLRRINVAKWHKM